MKTIANRLIVLAAGTIALGAVAFGQTNMTAQIPFAFHTVAGTMPAGTYQFTSEGADRVVMLRNTATRKDAFAGYPMRNTYRKVSSPTAEFLCSRDSCTLKAIRSWNGSLEYSAPRKSKDPEKSMALISVPLKPVNTD
jgi:hypothetical protein